MNKDVTLENIWSTKQMIIAIVFAISVTFTLSMIWSRFLYNEQHIKTLELRLDKKDLSAKADREALWEVMQTKADK